MNTPQAQELRAGPGWRAVEFISDLHLQPSEPGTFEAWRRYMAACEADALFILGDLFEAWVGDDAIHESGFDADCAQVLRETAARLPLFFLVGNRDFLVGEALARGTGMTLLQDPVVFSFGEHRWLLSHGDALCVDDHEYLAFRAMVRSAQWQQDFLAQPLAQRQAIARGLRAESERLKATDRVYADVDTATALQWLQAADAPVLVHGHTHKPGEQALDTRHRRIVLSDWDALAAPPRLQALRITVAGDVRRIGLA